ncbi:hypothetical protein ColLi_09147 [Colletotrichum liriopes]|uniref:Uncharacterized protein n=1 Tax=Colletotrichum liriopes TaxID=708192 RepID=A0AA37GS96_9PEZI|nr:hypothetical protein ColLi_09147 [Colletotrichum liriopes]
MDQVMIPDLIDLAAKTNIDVRSLNEQDMTYVLDKNLKNGTLSKSFHDDSGEVALYCLEDVRDAWIYENWRGDETAKMSPEGLPTHAPPSPPPPSTPPPTHRSLPAHAPPPSSVSALLNQTIIEGEARLAEYQRLLASTSARESSRCRRRAWSQLLHTLLPVHDEAEGLSPPV